MAVNDGTTLSDTTPTTIMVTNSLRAKVDIINHDAAAVIYVFKGSGATADKGIPLYPRGSMSDQRDNQGYIYKGPYTVISDTNGTKVTWVEENA